MAMEPEENGVFGRRNGNLKSESFLEKTGSLEKNKRLKAVF
jgi:hypothetical protein